MIGIVFLVDTVSRVPPLWTDKDMVRQSISKMKNEKSARPLGAMSETIKAAGVVGDHHWPSKSGYIWWELF